MENRGDSKTPSTQGERQATLAAVEPDLSSENLSQQAGTIKKSTKSRLAHPFKTLREASRSAGLKLLRSGGKDSNPEEEEMSQGAESSSAGSTLERGVKLKKSKDKKKKNESNDDGVVVEHLLFPDNTEDNEDGKKKGKKKKGSSLVRKFSSKYRSNKSGGEETSPQTPRKEEILTTSEISANDLSEDSQSLASNSTFASSIGTRTPDQSPSHPLPSSTLLEEDVELPRNVEASSNDQVTVTSDIKRISPTPPPRKQQKINEEVEEEEGVKQGPSVLYQKSAELTAPKLIAMTTEINKPLYADEDNSVSSLSESTPTPPQIMEELEVSSLQEELKAADAAAEKTESNSEIQAEQLNNVEHLEQKEECNNEKDNAATPISPDVQEIIFPVGLDDAVRAELSAASSSKDSEMVGQQHCHYFLFNFYIAVNYSDFQFNLHINMIICTQ